MNLPAALLRSAFWSQPPLSIVADVVVALSFVVIVVAVVLDFASYYRQDRKVVGSDRSLVETGSMAAFFVAYYLAIKLRLLDVALPSGARTALIVAGLALMVLGVVFNVWGRLVLKAAWANQITIYEGQELLTTGPFSVVRHPLYASLIWMFVGGSLVYANVLSLLLMLGVFVPMMYVRAKKEDALLREHFAETYDTYRDKTGMFLPRLQPSRLRRS